MIYILCFIYGLFLKYCGYSFYTWQFHVFDLMFVMSYVLGMAKGEKYELL